MPLHSIAMALMAASSTGLAANPKLTPHLSVHLRPEVRANPAFIAEEDDTAFAVQQGIRVGVTGAVDRVSGRVDVQEVRPWGTQAGSTSSAPVVHAYQGYIQVNTGSGYVRVGRQEIHLLNGYFLSKAPFNPAGRSFDAARWHLGSKSVDADIFVSQLVASAGWVDGDAPSDLGDWFGGGQATLKTSKVFTPSVFVLAKAGGATELEPDRLDRWVGPGARATLSAGNTRVDIDGMVQLGDASGTPRQAYNVIARAEQVFDGQLRPGVALRLDQSSGHACATAPASGACTSDVNRSMDLQFGRNFHLRGVANQVAGTNSRQMAVEGFISPGKKTRLELVGSWFQLTDPEGPWVRNGGDLQGTGWTPGNEDPNLGWELDARAVWKPSKSLLFEGGSAWFQPIGAGAELTGDTGQLYIYMRTKLAF